MGWAGLKNGELLALAEKQFDVFITADRQLRRQQNLAGRRLSVIVLSTNQVPAVIALLPAIRLAINGIQPGTYEELALPSSF